MVYLEGPGNEEFFAPDSGVFNDHERLALNRFRCPVCHAPFDLIECFPDRPIGGVYPLPGEETCDLVAACRRCDVTVTREDWHAWIRAA